MSDCCSPDAYRQLFSERSAQQQAKRYRRRGLDAVSSRICELVRERGVQGASVLEVGGGIGAIQLELLKAGAASATSVELTPTYEEAAAELLREDGLQDRAERRVMDFAENAALVPPADVVVMNRVLCCYHDMPRLAGAAAEHASRLLVLSFPKRRSWTRLVIALANLGFWAFRRQFRIFLHPPEGIRATAESRGLHTVWDRSGLFWQVMALERQGPL